MPDSTAPAPAPASASPIARLRGLLLSSTSGLGEEAVIEARALGPERAGDVVAVLIESELSRPTADGSALRAAQLACELRLDGAAPALVRCVELPFEAHPLRRAALMVLSRLGTSAIDPLLAAFDRCGAIATRARIAEALSRTAAEDDRIRAALVRMLEDDPATGARYLAERGEWRSVPDLIRTFDRLVGDPIADCGVCAVEHLSAISASLRVLGGSLSDGQRARWDVLLERNEPLWVPFDDPFTPPGALSAALLHGARPGRNDACPCGSGKKYKKCHLDADRRKAGH